MMGRSAAASRKPFATAQEQQAKSLGNQEELVVTQGDGRNAMTEEKTVVMESGTESRTLTWGTKPDGNAYVREASRGDLTETILGAAERTTTISFEPTADYSLADVADTVETHAGDCYITDFEDALTLWGIRYTRDERTVPLRA